MRTLASRRTVRPCVLLQGPLVQEEPPRRLEYDVALERGHALELGRQLIGIPSLERRSVCGDVRVQVEKRREHFCRCGGEEMLADEFAELCLGAGAGK